MLRRGPGDVSAADHSAAGLFRPSRARCPPSLTLSQTKTANLSHPHFPLSLLLAILVSPTSTTCPPQTKPHISVMPPQYAAPAASTVGGGSTTIVAPRPYIGGGIGIMPYYYPSPFGYGATMMMGSPALLLTLSTSPSLSSCIHHCIYPSPSLSLFSFLGHPTPEP